MAHNYIKQNIPADIYNIVSGKFKEMKVIKVIVEANLFKSQDMAHSKKLIVNSFIQ